MSPRWRVSSASPRPPSAATCAPSTNKVCSCAPTVVRFQATSTLNFRCATGPRADAPRSTGSPWQPLSVSDGSVVGLTGGTTTTELARTLADRDSITIVTNALNIASELVLRSSIRLVVIGGSARHASYELVGPSAELMLSRYHLDVAFIGTDGITLTAGCTTHDEMEAQTDRAFLHRSKRVVVTADSSKLGKSAFARICDITEIDDLVTDDEADPSLLSEFVDAGVHIITC